MEGNRFEKFLGAAALALGLQADSSAITNNEQRPSAVTRQDSHEKIEPATEISHAEKVVSTATPDAGTKEVEKMQDDSTDKQRQAEERKSTMERVVTAIRSFGSTEQGDHGPFESEVTTGDHGEMMINVFAHVEVASDKGEKNPHLPVIQLTQLDNGKFAARILLPDPLPSQYWEGIREEDITQVAAGVTPAYDMALRRIRTIEENIVSEHMTGEQAEQYRRENLNNVSEVVEEQLRDTKNQYVK